MSTQRAYGKVSLIGAGPGDPGLITEKGLSRLRQADVVVYDRLIDPRLLDEARAEAELVYVGKAAGDGQIEQEEINQLLADRGIEGKTVARLKGGDPFVFGRGGEEVLSLARAGVPFEVVPGVSSAIAAPAYAGIPLTHRGVASSFTVVTGSEDPSKDESSVQWEALARSGGTIVVLMGWRELGRITDRLMEAGMAPETPAALVQWATQPRQRTLVGTLRDLVQRGVEEGFGPPVVAVIGPVVSFRSDTAWSDAGPLSGKRVLVTRSREQASSLSRMLAAEGAETLEVPAIRVAPLEEYGTLDAAIQSLGSFRWVVFTSVNGVEAFFDRLNCVKLDARAFGGSKVAAIGPATSVALKNHGIATDLLPEAFTSECLLQALEAEGVAESRILLPRVEMAPDLLFTGLQRLGADPVQAPAYRTLVPDGLVTQARELLGKGAIDAVTFASSSTVSNLMSAVSGDTRLLDGTMVACIGPVTAQRAEEHGLRVDVVANEHTIPGLVRSMKEYFARRGAV